MPGGRNKQGPRSTGNRSTLLPGLRAARKRRGLTQRELATMAGTGAGTIWDLENQNRGAYSKTIKCLCETLGVTPSELMAEEHSKDH